MKNEQGIPEIAEAIEAKMDNEAINEVERETVLLIVRKTLEMLPDAVGENLKQQLADGKKSPRVELTEFLSANLHFQEEETAGFDPNIIIPAHWRLSARFSDFIKILVNRKDEDAE